MDRIARLAFACGLAAALGAGGVDASRAGAGARLRIVSSSHQDIAWMDSPEACRRYRDESCITPALALMARDPDYCFVMENMLNLMEYVETHPERKAEILAYTRQGRMEWGATFNQPYESLLTGEQLVRETYFGRRWLRTNFPGCDARVYFNPDVPGRSLQMSQILAKAGIPYMVISRFHEGYWRWASPDGSEVLAYSPGHYTNSSSLLNAKPEEAVAAIEARLGAWAERHAARDIAPDYPLLNSVDFSKPTDFGPLIKLWNSRHAATPAAAPPAAPGPAAPSTMGYSPALGLFEALTAGSPRFDRIGGERPNLWLYIHGPTHHWAISAQREAGWALPAAEAFQTIEALLEGSFERYPAAALAEAWLASIYPDHGWGGKEGQITDRLFREKYELARDVGRRFLHEALASITARIGIREGRSTPIAVFNTLSWPRTDIAAVSLPGTAGPYEVRDAEGAIVPSQVAPPGPDDPPRVVRLEFKASDVPGIGYKTYYALPSTGLPPAAAAPALRGETVAVESPFYRLRLAPGGVAGIFDKKLGREILKTDKFLGFELFTMRSVGNGAGEFGRVQQPTMEGFDRLSAHRPAWRPDEAASGPLRTVVRLDQTLPNCRIRQRIILHQTIKRIDCEVEILGWDGLPYREWRMAVPVNAPGGQAAYEVPLGVVEIGTSEAPGTGGPAYGGLVYDEPMSAIRPREVQNFLCAGDANFAVTLSTSVAVCDYADPTPDPVGYPVLQPLLLASRRSCHGQGNWYLQEGDHRYRFSLTSHAAGWRNGWRPGIGANVPLVPVIHAREERAEGAALPAEMGFLRISAPNVLLSALKKSEDDDSAVIRVYDIEGKEAEARLELFVPIAAAQAANLIEDPGASLSAGKDGVRLGIGRFAVETIKVRPAARR